MGEINKKMVGKCHNKCVKRLKCVMDKQRYRTRLTYKCECLDCPKGKKCPTSPCVSKCKLSCERYGERIQKKRPTCDFDAFPVQQYYKCDKENKEPISDWKCIKGNEWHLANCLSNQRKYPVYLPYNFKDCKTGGKATYYNLSYKCQTVKDCRKTEELVQDCKIGR